MNYKNATFVESPIEGPKTLLLRIKRFVLPMLLFLVSGSIYAQGDLGITVRCPPHAQPKDTLEYTITVTNSGPASMTNVLVKQEVDSNITALSIVSCKGGLANKGSSACPLIADLTIINLEGPGLVIPAIPDGGAVVIKVAAKIDSAADNSKFRFSVTASPGTPASDPNTANNINRVVGTIHRLLNGQVSSYYMDPMAVFPLAPDSLPIAGGGTNMKFILISGPPVPELGPSFTIPLKVNPIVSRNPDTTYGWDSWGPWDSLDTDIISAVPLGKGLFAKLPAKNRLYYSTQGLLYGDSLMRLKLSQDSIQSLGVVSFTVGKIPEPTKSVLIGDSLKVYGSWVTFASTNPPPWSTWIAPIGQLELFQDSNRLLVSPLLRVPYDNTYPFRFTAILGDSVAVPDSFMLDGYQWANIGYAGVNFWTPNNVLPIHFGTITAQMIHDQLKVDWTTQAEKEVAYFEVQASRDGKHFYTLGRVNSQAKDGHSETELKYGFTQDITAMSVMGSLLLGFLVLGWRKKTPRFRCVACWLILIGGGVTMAGCSKKAAIFNGQDLKIYVRIAQVDIYGTVEYSKIVMAIKE